jgi:hypothetical protein
VGETADGLTKGSTFGSGLAPPLPLADGDRDLYVLPDGFGTCSRPTCRARRPR